MKKTIIFLFVIALMLSACGKNETVNYGSDSNAEKNQSSQVVLTDPNVPGYTIKSAAGDWETKYSASANVSHIVDYRGHYAYVITEIENLGTNPIWLYDLCLDGYVLEDKTGVRSEHDMFEACYPAIVFPGEKGYLSGVTNTLATWPEDCQLSVILEEDGIAETCLPSKDWDETITFLGTSEVEIFSEGDGYVQMKGNVTNTSLVETGSIYINAVLYNAKGEPLGLLLGMADSLLPEEKTEFVAVGSFAERINVSDVISWEIEAYSSK